MGEKKRLEWVVPLARNRKAAVLKVGSASSGTGISGILKAEMHAPVRRGIMVTRAYPDPEERGRVVLLVQIILPEEERK